jgi:hypothetical protein
MVTARKQDNTAFRSPTATFAAVQMPAPRRATPTRRFLDQAKPKTHAGSPSLSLQRRFIGRSRLAFRGREKTAPGESECGHAAEVNLGNLGSQEKIFCWTALVFFLSTIIHVMNYLRKGFV